MHHEQFERRYAQIGRALATNLRKWAKERDAESKRAITSNQVELCRLHREEQSEAQHLIEAKNGEAK